MIEFEQKLEANRKANERAKQINDDLTQEVIERTNQIIEL